MTWLFLLVFGYLILTVGLVIAEPFLIFPAPPGSGYQVKSKSEPVQLVAFTASDNVKLSALFYRPEGVQGAMIFCHGNGESIASLEDHVIQLGKRYQCAVLAFDYRGYGDSEGHSTSDGLVLDGQAAYDFLIEQGFRSGKILVYGRSLGGAVAVSIAANNEIGGLILHSTFSSLSEVASSKFPYLPVSLLLRNRFPSAERIAKYNGPLLQRHGTADKVVPFRFGKKLHEAAGTPDSLKTWITEEGVGHHQWPSEKFWRELDRMAASVFASGH